MLCVCMCVGMYACVCVYMYLCIYVYKYICIFFRNLSLPHMMTGVSNCYICEEQFDSNELSIHEKSCLERIVSNDVQYTREEATGSTSAGQFETCHLCGKLYSKHSMDIHIKQCEKTRAMQRNVGTVADSKTKGRGHTDTSESKTSITRTPISKPTSRIPVRRSTTSGVKESSLGITKDRSSVADRCNRAKSPSVSSSFDNLSLVNKKEETPGEEKRKILRENKSAFRKDNTSTPSSGLHKCYLCGQMYGIRSLPIHEKQCYTKQKRSSTEKKENKRGATSFNPSKYRHISAGAVVQPSPM